MANLLAIESSAALCSVALSLDGNVTWCEQEGERSHTQNMMGFIDQLLQEKKVRVTDMDAIVFSAGPGSFTGVRLATSVAKSLAYAADIPVIPVSSLAVIAQGVARVTGSHEPCLVATDARMGEVYIADFIFSNGIAIPVNPEALKAIGDISLERHVSSRLAGNAITLLQSQKGFERFSIIEQQAHAMDLLIPAQAMLERNEVQSALAAEAVYLRGKSSWKNVDQQRLEKNRPM